MDSKDAYEIALKIADIYLKALQFFIAICALFGGWIVVDGLPQGYLNRGFLCVIFLASTGTLLFGKLSLLRRAGAAIELSRLRLETQNEPIDSAVAPLFSAKAMNSTRNGTVVGMCGVILSVILLIITADVTS